MKSRGLTVIILAVCLVLGSAGLSYRGSGGASSNSSSSSSSSNANYNNSSNNSRNQQGSSQSGGNFSEEVNKKTQKALKTFKKLLKDDKSAREFFADQGQSPSSSELEGSGFGSDGKPDQTEFKLPDQGKEL